MSVNLPFVPWIRHGFWDVLRVFLQPAGRASSPKKQQMSFQRPPCFEQEMFFFELLFFHVFSIPIASMCGIFNHRWMVDVHGFHAGKYTVRPMDPLGIIKRSPSFRWRYPAAIPTHHWSCFYSSNLAESDAQWRDTSATANAKHGWEYQIMASQPTPMEGTSMTNKALIRGFLTTVVPLIRPYWGFDFSWGLPYMGVGWLAMIKARWIWIPNMAGVSSFTSWDVGPTIGVGSNFETPWFFVEQNVGKLPKKICV